MSDIFRSLLTQYASIHSKRPVVEFFPDRPSSETRLLKHAFAAAPEEFMPCHLSALLCYWCSPLAVDELQELFGTPVEPVTPLRITIDPPPCQGLPHRLTCFGTTLRGRASRLFVVTTPERTKLEPYREKLCSALWEHDYISTSLIQSDATKLDWETINFMKKAPRVEA